MNDFTKGNVSKQILLFSLPLLIGNIFQQFYSMADAYVVGRFVGGAALAAVGTCGPVLNLLLAVVIGLTTGASVLISQLYGAQKLDALRRTVSTGMLFMGGLVLLISALGVFCAPLFLRWLSVPEDVMPAATTYLRICLAGSVFPMFYNMYTAYLRALGDSRNPLYILIISTLLNVGLDVLFVVSFGWGVAGTAYATVLSQAIATLCCWLYAKHRLPVLHVRRLTFDSGLLRSVLQYSIPSAIQLSVVSLASLTIQQLVNSFGANAMAGYTAAVKIDSFGTMPASSLSMALSIFVAQNMGAGQEQRAKQGLRTTLWLALLTSAVISLLALLGGRWLIASFVDPADPNFAAIVGIGTDYLSVIVLFYWLFAIFFSFNGFFRGVGDAVIVMALTITSLTLRSIAAHLLVAWGGMGPEAVAWSIPIGWALCSLFAWLYYSRRWWAGKLAKAVQGEDAPPANGKESMQKP